MQKKSYFIILLLLVAVGYGVFYTVSFYTTRQSLQAYENYQNIFRNDTYGGKTPEETLQLFVAALKANDIDTAVLYFMPDDTGSREKWRGILEKDKVAGSFEEIIDVLSETKLESSFSDKRVTYKIPNAFGSLLLNFVFNGQVWKIESL